MQNNDKIQTFINFDSSNKQIKVNSRIFQFNLFTFYFLKHNKQNNLKNRNYS